MLQSFKASWGWYEKFRKRWGLKSVLLHGEGADVDKENPELLVALEKLYQLIGEYDPNWVFNMDETGLFFRLLPRYSVLLPDEDVSTSRGKKKSKERVSLAVCCNASGTERLPVTMISKSKFPACISGRK